MNSSNWNDDFKKYTKAFEQSVKLQQKDLEYMVKKSNVSNRFIDRKNKILSHTIAYQKYAEEHIIELQKEKLFLEKVITSLKAVCVIHGIVDYPRFLQWGKMVLVSRANELQKEDKMQIPYSLNEKLKKLSEEERNTIESILFRDINLELKALLQKIGEHKKVQYGIRIQGNQEEKRNRKKTDR